MEDFFVYKKYTDKTTTPIAWLTFSKWIRGPLGLLGALRDLLLYSGTFIAFVIYFIPFLLVVVFEIGIWTWKKSSYYSIIIIDVYRMLIYLVLFIANPASSSSLIATIIFGSFEIYYYIKRELLFDGKKVNNSEDSYEITNYKYLRDKLRDLNIPLEEELRRKQHDYYLSSYESDALSIRRKMSDLYSLVKVNRFDEELYENIKKEIKVFEEKYKKNSELFYASNNGEPREQKALINHDSTNTSIKYCRNCGSKLQEGSKYCPFCGIKL